MQLIFIQNLINGHAKVCFIVTVFWYLKNTQIVYVAVLKKIVLLIINPLTWRVGHVRGGPPGVAADAPADPLAAHLDRNELLPQRLL